MTLHPLEISPSEASHSDVKRLGVVDETEGLLGWIYTDLSYRQRTTGGSPNFPVILRRADSIDSQAACFNYRPSCY
jgi:Zn-dependent oligopeptidase